VTAVGEAVLTRPSDPGRAIGFGKHRYPLLLPRWRDPRLHLAATVISLQVLGQTVLGFDLSIAQILLCLGTCGVLELGITFWERRVVAWPASALLTGNGVAFILRVPGTEHGDWWSTRGWPIFVSVSALSLVSKYLITYRGRHLFNPSNLGLVVCFLLLGPLQADPQDLWWGPISPAVVAALVVIALGGVGVTWRQGLLGAAAGFYVTFAVGTGALAASGHCMTARWSAVPVCDGSYWWVLVSSPEILVFTLFMITDPQTIPAGRVGRIVHGVGVGVVATLLVAPQRTEYATKVAILAALVVVCAAGPLIARLSPALGSRRDDPWTWLRTSPSGAPARARRLAVLGTAAVAVLVATVLAGGATRDPRPVDAVDGGLDPGTFAEVPDGIVPDVTIGESARRTQPPLTETTAQQMGHDLVAALLAEDVGASFDIDSMEVVLLRDPASPQAPPRLGVVAVGTVTDATGDESALDGSFAMAEVGGRFVITERLG
jgi:hypothetical protein